jgi:hypothetical protein
MQNCKIILKDKYLSSTLTKEVFDSYDDFRKEIEVALFEKNKAIPVKLSFGDKGFQKMKMLKLSRKVFNRSNVTVVEVSAPNPEKGEVIGEIINSENKKIGKYSVIIPDIREGFSSKPDMDTIMSLWLGNYFTPETTEEVQTAMNELREILTKLNAKDLSKESASFIKSLIGDGGIYDQYSTIVGRDAVIDDVVMQLNKKLEDRLIKEPLTGQYRDLLSVSERERVYQDFLQAVDNPPREEGTSFLNLSPQLQINQIRSMLQDKYLLKVF